MEMRLWSCRNREIQAALHSTHHVKAHGQFPKGLVGVQEYGTYKNMAGLPCSGRPTMTVGLSILYKGKQKVLRLERQVEASCDSNPRKKKNI